MTAKTIGRMPRGGRRTGSGRKKGVPNKVTAEVKILAQQYAPEAFEALMKIVRRGNTDSARVAAVKEILDRAYGKAPQAIVGDPENPLASLPTKIEYHVISRPPQETREEWIERRRREVAEQGQPPRSTHGSAH